MAPDPHDRAGYLTIDALVGLSVATIAVSAAVGLAAQTAVRVAEARDRLAAAKLAETLYDELYDGRRPDGSHAGVQDGREWRYTIASESGAGARSGQITIERRRTPLELQITLPPAPGTPSSSS